MADRGDNAVVAQRLLAEESIMSTSFSTDEKNQKKLLRYLLISFSWKCSRCIDLVRDGLVPAVFRKSR